MSLEEQEMICPWGGPKPAVEDCAACESEIEMASTDAKASAYRVFTGNLSKMEGMSVKRIGMAAPVERSKGCLHGSEDIDDHSGGDGLRRSRCYGSEIKAKIILD
jgi:hypothetical protein